MPDHPMAADMVSDLIAALESARTRLSIAIATESKSTPPASRRQYLATAERISRFMRNLRKSEFSITANRCAGCRLRESLQQIKEEHDARKLCQILEDMVSELE